MAKLRNGRQRFKKFTSLWLMGALAFSDIPSVTRSSLLESIRGNNLDSMCLLHAAMFEESIRMSTLQVGGQQQNFHIVACSHFRSRRIVGGNSALSSRVNWNHR